MTAARERVLAPTLDTVFRPEEWLQLGAPERFASAFSTAASESAPPQRLVTFPSLNAAVLKLAARFGGRGLVRGYDHLLTAHLLVATASADPSRVVTRVATSPVYELGPLAVDVIDLARSGVQRAEVALHLSERRAEWCQRQPATHRSLRTLRRLAASRIPLDLALPRSIAVATAAAGSGLDLAAIEVSDVPLDLSVAGLFRAPRDRRPQRMTR